MVNIEAGVADAQATMVAVSVTSIANDFIVVAMPSRPRPVCKFFSQGRTSLSAVSPDANIKIGGIAVA